MVADWTPSSLTARMPLFSEKGGGSLMVDLEVEGLIATRFEKLGEKSLALNAIHGTMTCACKHVATTMSAPPPETMGPAHRAEHAL